MVKLAILNSVSFGKERNFDDLKYSKMREYLEGKVIFEDYNNTPEMLAIVKKTFSCFVEPDIEVENCYYDSEHLIQGFIVDNDNELLHGKIVMVKRKIHGNDSYTFMEYNEAEKQDPYEYEDITIDDIIVILKKKSVISCVVVKCNGEITNDNLLFLNSNEDVGKIVLEKDKKEMLYLNIANIVIRYQNTENENRIDEIINQRSHAYGAHYIFNQFDIGLGILDCVCPSFSENKNEIVSKLLEHDIYGDAILFMQSNYDGDTETFLNLDDVLFKKLHNIITTKSKVKRSNPHFFNIYQEL